MENVRELDLGQPAIDEKTRAMYTTHAHRESEAQAGRLRYLTKLTEKEAKAVKDVRELIAKACKCDTPIDTVGRAMICTPCGGDYGAVTAWVIAIEGSPPRGMLFVSSMRGHFDTFAVNAGKSRALGSRQHTIVGRLLTDVLGGPIPRNIENVPPVIIAEYIK